MNQSIPLASLLMALRSNGSDPMAAMRGGSDPLAAMRSGYSDPLAALLTANPQIRMRALQMASLTISPENSSGSL